MSERDAGAVNLTEVRTDMHTLIWLAFKLAVNLTLHGHRGLADGT
jgi:hypothetical protein